MKIVSIVGARPQFVKLAPLSKALRTEFCEVIIHTGQHYDKEMSKLFFDELRIPKPDYNLGVGSGTHGAQTGEMLKEIEKVLVKERPDMVIVFGDTNSTIAGTLAAVKLHITVGHVEAGLRSFNRRMPEEVNRVLTDHASDLLFAPTDAAVTNLRNEGLTAGVYQVGDVMFDALLHNYRIAKEKSEILETMGLEAGQYYTLTIHRQENTDVKKNLETILQTLADSGKKIIFPAHPRTRKNIRNYGLERLVSSSGIQMVPPLGYLDFLRLMAGSKAIITDSGGAQKEAYLLKVPCITLREETEWVETVEDGWNIIVGSNKDKILDAVTNFSPKGTQEEVFGNGKASERIRDILKTQIA